MSTPQPSSLLLEEEIDLRSFSFVVSESAAKWDQTGPLAVQSQIQTISERIENPVLRALMLRVFYDLARLIEYLRIIDTEAGSYLTTENVIAVLNLVRSESTDLFSFISTRLIASVESEKLFDTLDGAYFAVQHELHRAYAEELADIDTTDNQDILRAKLGRARRLLSNCFQQSFITIGQVFNPFFDGAGLFNELQVRQRQSLTLLYDLTKLIELSTAVETGCDIESTMMLMEKLEQFRGSSMQYLMYRDWSDYECEVEKIMDCKTIEARAKQIHGFTCYLETLRSHVRMRTCLQADLS
jgi:hypothetical protein